MNKNVKTEDAVGMVLAHDITEIRKDEFKGRAFRKGHVIQDLDVCHLQRLGKRHIYVLHIEPGYLHEDTAAERLAKAFCGPGTAPSGAPREGKIKMVAETDGLLKVEVEALTAVNLLGDVMCASRHTNTRVQAGAEIAGTRAIPLVVREEVIDEAVRMASVHGGLFRVLPLRRASTGLVITGSEIVNRLIEDEFEPILRKKMTALGSRVAGVRFTGDDAADIAAQIRDLLDAGADLILTTGGMSVDPDDMTRKGVEMAGGEILFYGAPILPGSMFMVAAVGNVPVLGVPACGIYHEATALDLLLPRILAGETLTRETIARMGHGGLCLHCETCRYPVCPFGK